MNSTLGNVTRNSNLGNSFLYQGVVYDSGQSEYQVRHREYSPVLKRFGVRDPSAVRTRATSAEHSGFYVALGGNPLLLNDPAGLCTVNLVCWGAYVHDPGNPGKHCEWQVSDSVEPSANGKCHGSGHTCSRRECCYLCASPEWRDPDCPDPPDAVVVETLTVDESVCQCVHATCVTYPQQYCYSPIPYFKNSINSNTEAKCVAKACGLPTHAPPGIWVPGWDKDLCPW
jgi:RHS repeat-associated protein